MGADPSPAASSTPDYTMGFSEEILEAVRRYAGAPHAAYLLPYLRPGLRVLDVGCGMGTISLVLAAAVEPGELHGVDMEESQIALARSLAESRRQRNATFHVGDVTALPFEDGFFDVAHCHNVLMHVPDTRAVLAEVKRVVRPGGIVGCREMIVDSSFTSPDYGVIGNAWDMFGDLLAADDGHPQMGRELKGHLAEAGFTNVQVSASFDLYQSPADIEFVYGMARRWFLAPERIEAAIAYGAATRELSDALAEAHARWKDDPAALVAVAHGEAIAGRP